MNAGNMDLAKDKLKKAASIYLALAEKSTGSIQDHWIEQTEDCYKLASNNTIRTDDILSEQKPHIKKQETSIKKQNAFTCEKSSIKLSDIGGLEDVKTEMKENIFFPLKNPEIYEEYGLTPPKGILLYGPPGTGKTLLCRAFAGEADASIYIIKGPEILDKFVGEPERKVRELFTEARNNMPSIIVFDEIDAVVPDRGMYSGGSGVRETIVNQILTELDGFEGLKGVIVIGTTNRPDILDRAIIRPGRFDKVIYVPEPDFDARVEILKIHTKKIPLNSDVNVEDLAKNLNGYTGADIEAICREAAMNVVREKMQLLLQKESLTTDDKDEKEMNKEDCAILKKVNLSDIQSAVDKIKPTMTSRTKEMYEQIHKQFLSIHD